MRWRHQLTEDTSRCPPPTCQCDLYGMGDNCGNRAKFLGENDQVAFGKRKYSHLALPHRGKKAFGNQ